MQLCEYVEVNWKTFSVTEKQKVIVEKKSKDTGGPDSKIIKYDYQIFCCFSAALDTRLFFVSILFFTRGLCSF